MGVALGPSRKQYHQPKQGDRILPGAACLPLKENSRPEGPRSAAEPAPRKHKKRKTKKKNTADIPQESHAASDGSVVQQCAPGQSICATIPQGFKQEAATVRGESFPVQRFNMHAMSKNWNVAAQNATTIVQHSSSRFSDVNPSLIPTLDALDSACAARMASTNLFQRTKRHLAEIDKALQAFEPEVIQRPSGYDNGRIMCKCQQQYHQVNSKKSKRRFHASLKSVWKWYEEPSIFGAKVVCGGRGEDIFDAYFVPYLSAVQLFGPSNDAPPLFEFFETDLPWNRLPLYQRILQLVRDKTSGDSEALERSFVELHPASWYAVAWYPIYKIPDGLLSCAFLTYHSAAHLLSSSRSLSLPVLGLQTYKCQAEQWCRLKEEHEALPIAADTLQQHLATLRAGAEAMSRKCANLRHADYEHFTNRIYNY